VKIAFFIHCFFPEHYNGTEVYTLELARRLQETGHQVVVVTAKFKGEAPRRGPVTRFFYEGVPVICFDKNHFLNRRVRDTYYQEAMREPLREILNEIRPDIATEGMFISFPSFKPHGGASGSLERNEHSLRGDADGFFRDLLQQPDAGYFRIVVSGPQQRRVQLSGVSF